MLPAVPGLVMHVPHVDIDVGDPDVAAILGELDLLKRTGAHYDAAGAIARLETARATVDRRTNLDDWTGPERHALARALDHLRNLLPPPYSRQPAAPWPLVRLRDTVIGAQGFAPKLYEIRLTVPDHANPEFASYTGDYEPGDRLVRVKGRQQLRVVLQEPGSEHERLICELWTLLV
jgi:hypothetical protein